MKKDWYDFQERIAHHFRGLGVQAVTNKTIKGVRTDHDLDIYVTSKYLGTNIKWIVEAKYWQTKIPKEKVLALRTIVDDIGADKGFIISQVGFQSGSKEAALNSNIELLTFDELVQRSTSEINTIILESFSRRLRLLEQRYYSHSKKNRIEYGLRGDILEFPIRFSGNLLIIFMFNALDQARKFEYPIFFDKCMTETIGEEKADNFSELINWLNQNLNWFDEKILFAEYQMLKDGKFCPWIEKIVTDIPTTYEMTLITDGLDVEEKEKTMAPYRYSYFNAKNG
ncbi:restriction endonuclease [Acinetobacter guerrae]|uniref:Restriction endonuclease n=1 Tax=Acinetobacter guerrae TaxID=1843371 RepID=A0A3A8F1I7_9GAMM|nr:restriction endonuclease [Acinetobacter guerrae]MPW45211.1 restriction endonuclease [Acinetobacter guerrae]RKG36184.1 restriction endonuclease [Acinetobacter guerrae]